MTRVRDLLELQQAADQSTASNMIKLASRLLSLTVVRVGALCMARWSDFEGIDWGRCTNPNLNPIWRIPASGMNRQRRNKENPEFDHLVPLSRQAIETLRAVRRLTGDFEFVFTSRRSCRAPMTDAALSSLYKRIKAGRYQNRMVPRGWRSAFPTILNERAALEGREGDRLSIDMALGHLPIGLSASEWTYNRAKYTRPRAPLFQAWADLISEGCP
ncbi:hypothetical protein HZF05_07610 [Sphingomonas sp. CGMCC 1.13654]|uniref:Tyr recombinase domain-containing protein n=2 Tax=Sphingomonas chungangi TaxID=2683589 RepID=A0A838L5K3_9SPHN|nr:hypothetical protein [Sphingomonas chungangi]